MESRRKTASCLTLKWLRALRRLSHTRSHSKSSARFGGSGSAYSHGNWNSRGRGLIRIINETRTGRGEAVGGMGGWVQWAGENWWWGWGWGRVGVGMDGGAGFVRLSKTCLTPSCLRKGIVLAGTEIPGRLGDGGGGGGGT